MSKKNGAGSWVGSKSGGGVEYYVGDNGNLVRKERDEAADSLDEQAYVLGEADKRIEAGIKSPAAKLGARVADFMAEGNSFQEALDLASPFIPLPEE